MNPYFFGIYRIPILLDASRVLGSPQQMARSFLGVAWSVIQPLGMTILLAVVFGRIFHRIYVEFAPYILSGMITWDFFIATLVGGSLSFVQADAYIKQYRHRWRSTRCGPR